MSKKYLIISFLLLFLISFLALIFFYRFQEGKINNDSYSLQNNPSSQEIQKTIPPQTSPPTEDLQNIPAILPPLDKTKERITKKAFGIFITPKNSPVQPERFSGYHTGVDLEIFPEELNTEIPIKAVCEGILAFKGNISGYGGLVIENCHLNGEPITIIYGHLQLQSVAANPGETIKIGTPIGILGKDKSPETGQERKHLHLGFRKGTAINLQGYVKSQAELSDWIDPCLYICED